MGGRTEAVVYPRAECPSEGVLRAPVGVGGVCGGSSSVLAGSLAEGALGLSFGFSRSQLPGGRGVEAGFGGTDHKSHAFTTVLAGAEHGRL